MSEIEVQENETPVQPIVEEETVSYPYMVAVKFHNSTRPYSFGTEDDLLDAGQMVVVETSQGIEMGEVMAMPLSTAKFPPTMPLKPVLRRATEQDMHDYEDNLTLAEEAFDICRQEIQELDLSMNLQSADYMLDRSKVLFIYVADQRVDFRELLRRLNARLHCKIELRQIGERDKAKMIGGIGMCGMECCCARFKKRFDVISINMAKTQLLALNVDKLSGVCGKLMCCLKYENDNYKEMTEGLPKMGAHVEFEGEMYRVTSMNVMTNEARIENSETYQIITIQDLKEKAVVKKGIAMAKRGSRPPKQVGKTPERPVREKKISSAERIVKPDQLAPGELNISIDEPKVEKRQLNRNKDNKTKNAKPQGNVTTRNVNRNKHQDSHKGLKPQTDNNRSVKDHAKNNPNVTVRSFKSSKTKAAEAKGENK